MVVNIIWSCINSECLIFGDAFPYLGKGSFLGKYRKSKGLAIRNFWKALNQTPRSVRVESFIALQAVKGRGEARNDSRAWCLLVWRFLVRILVWEKGHIPHRLVRFVWVDVQKGGLQTELTVLAHRPAGEEAGQHTNLEVQEPLKKHSNKLAKMH